MTEPRDGCCNAAQEVLLLGSPAGYPDAAPQITAALEYCEERATVDHKLHRASHWYDTYSVEYTWR